MVKLIFTCIFSIFKFTLFCHFLLLTKCLTFNLRNSCSVSRGQKLSSVIFIANAYKLYLREMMKKLKSALFFAFCFQLSTAYSQTPPTFSSADIYMQLK